MPQFSVPSLRLRYQIAKLRTQLLNRRHPQCNNSSSSISPKDTPCHPLPQPTRISRSALRSQAEYLEPYYPWTKVFITGPRKRQLPSSRTPFLEKEVKNTSYPSNKWYSMCFLHSGTQHPSSPHEKTQ